MTYYRTQVINGLVRADEYLVTEWCKGIAEVFKVYYTSNRPETIFLLPETYADIYKPDMYYFNHGVRVNPTRVDVDKYVIPYQLMFYLRYKLAKEYSLIFTKCPQSIFVKTEHFNRQIRVTSLELDLK